eukprot:Sspe_Gene.101886::Locus_76562_Transcript_2_2_Confidence_0.667_Length_1089::g.101886::m.101886
MGWEGALARTPRLLQWPGRPTNPYRRVDHPSLMLSPKEDFSPNYMWSRLRQLLPRVGKQIPARKLSTRRVQMFGFRIFAVDEHRWPDFLKQRNAGLGWSKVGKPEGYTTYRTLMEKMYETGELAANNSEMYPQNIMQTWFGKRIQNRKIVLWKETMVDRRIHPHIYNWAPDVAPVAVYSELLDHQFQPAIDHDALMQLESYGGVDQWVLQNDPMYLSSWEMEQLRNYMLVRRMEMRKNHVMEEQARDLADWLFKRLQTYSQRKAELQPTEGEQAATSA